MRKANEKRQMKKANEKANEKGKWKTTWNCSRYVKRKLIKEGSYKISVTDEDYTYLAAATLSFYKDQR